MTPIAVKVTDEHIKHGRRGECDTCPIALALTQMGYFQVRVWDDHISMAASISANHEDYELPRVAKNFIIDFDDSFGKPPPQPFEFEITHLYERNDLIPSEIEDVVDEDPSD